MHAQMAAMCKLLESEGHMTPIATRQILQVVEAAEQRADLARQNEHYTKQPMSDDTKDES
ncbi:MULTISPECIES: hypothetical protein [unclassified Cryobacterium]|uniref:hypothetical protein n=1 Tax=unclassified Cryobacterium TaxID=2649013 RepID=UPI002AB590B3|nr:MULTISPECIES: hypothetical protein [unclassified Cryobacterium]MDY7542622.1 hypothetical protein [Cryobacterium sp. 5B3]MEB0264742.1 hypothetical protein [Cryobacterium sp. 10I5]MEB0273714.1 hypothetical protein [Cryobacterium sp. 5B3]